MGLAAGIGPIAPARRVTVIVRGAIVTHARSAAREVGVGGAIPPARRPCGRRSLARHHPQIGTERFGTPIRTEAELNLPAIPLAEWLLN